MSHPELIIGGYKLIGFFGGSSDRPVDEAKAVLERNPRLREHIEEVLNHTEKRHGHEMERTP